MIVTSGEITLILNEADVIPESSLPYLVSSDFQQLKLTIFMPGSEWHVLAPSAVCLMWTMKIFRRRRRMGLYSTMQMRG